jgi:hypothetical protein
MSHGFGKWQRALLTIIQRHGEPMTFAEMRGPDDERLPAAVERAARRALRRLTEDNVLITIGHGGPGDPLRYDVHPLFRDMEEHIPEGEALRSAA